MNAQPIPSRRRARDIPQHEEIWLLGQPPLQAYLEFVEEMAIADESVARATLVDEWRAANDYYGELEETEAGIADEVEIFDIDPALQPLADAVAADPRFRRAFDTLPTRFAMVEIDRLVVGHPYVSRNHIDRICTGIGSAPTPEALFRFCLPLDRVEAPVQVRKTGPRSLHVLVGVQRLPLPGDRAAARRHRSAGYEPLGPLGGMVGVMVGFGSNFVNVIQSDDRLLLHNGHHRVCALRALGITHAPCIVQSVTRLDELRLVASRTVLDDPAFYFRSKRPPLAEGFFRSQDPEDRARSQHGERGRSFDRGQRA